MEHKRILIVDDDSFLRDMYAKKFSEVGNDIDVADSGETALSKLREKTYDIVLIDMIMPGMTGVELLQHLKKEPANEKKPLYIMLSNQSDETDKLSAKEAGAAGYIVKAEFIPSEVVNEVQKIVEAYKE